MTHCYIIIKSCPNKHSSQGEGLTYFNNGGILTGGSWGSAPVILLKDPRIFHFDLVKQFLEENDFRIVELSPADLFLDAGKIVYLLYEEGKLTDFREIYR